MSSTWSFTLIIKQHDSKEAKKRKVMKKGKVSDCFQPKVCIWTKRDRRWRNMEAVLSWLFSDVEGPGRRGSQRMRAKENRLNRQVSWWVTCDILREESPDTLQLLSQSYSQRVPGNIFFCQLLLHGEYGQHLFIFFMMYQLFNWIDKQKKTFRGFTKSVSK